MNPSTKTAVLVLSLAGLACLAGCTVAHAGGGTPAPKPQPYIQQPFRNTTLKVRYEVTENEVGDDIVEFRSKFIEHLQWALNFDGRWVPTGGVADNNTFVYATGNDVNLIVRVHVNTDANWYSTITSCNVYGLGHPGLLFQASGGGPVNGYSNWFYDDITGKLADDIYDWLHCGWTCGDVSGLGKSVRSAGDVATPRVRQRSTQLPTPHRKAGAAPTPPVVSPTPPVVSPTAPPASASIHDAALAGKWTCPYCGASFTSPPKDWANFESFIKLHLATCQKRPH